MVSTNKDSGSLLMPLITSTESFVLNQWKRRYFWVLSILRGWLCWHCLMKSSGTLCIHASHSTGWSNIASNKVTQPLRRPLLLAVVSKTNAWTMSINSNSLITLNTHFAIVSPALSEMAGDAGNCPGRLQEAFVAIASLFSVTPLKKLNDPSVEMKDKKCIHKNFASVWTLSFKQIY